MSEALAASRAGRSTLAGQPAAIDWLKIGIGLALASLGLVLGLRHDRAGATATG